MGAILILGRTEDLCCQLAGARLRQAGRDVLFLPEERLLPQMAFAWTPEGLIPPAEGRIDFEGRTVRLADIDGVLYRFYGMPLPAEDFQTTDGRYVCSEWNALWMAWLNALPCPAVNRLQPGLWYKTRLNIPALRALMPALPFATPRLLVTTDPDAARAFRRRLSGPVSYAALSGSATYGIDDDDGFDKLTALSGALPLHLREELGGAARDAFVVGDRVTLVCPDGTVAPPAPPSLAARCRAVGAHLGLTFFQMSLVEAPDGVWHCLSLDRMPQFYACGPDACAEIVGNLAALLGGEKGAAA